MNGCLVCKGAGVEDDALTCTACREYAAGRHLHAGYNPPTSWGEQARKYVATMSWLDAAAQKYGIPPPADPINATGPWAHFVIALHAINHGKAAHAASEASYVLASPDVPGFPGLRDAAHRIRTAALDALASTGVAPVRTYRAVLPVHLPEVPLDADFDRPEWRHYQAAVNAARRHDAKAAQYAIMYGLKVNGFDDTQSPVTWYLKRLGAEISRAYHGEPTYSLRHVPATAEDLRQMLSHFQVAVPAGADLAEPIWTAIAGVHVALACQAWQACYRRIETARRIDMSPATRVVAEALLCDAEHRIPAKRKSKPEPVPDVRPAHRVTWRPNKGREKWR